VSIDIVAIDRTRNRVWVPVGTTGSADVFDIGTSAFTKVDGFKTVEKEMRGKKRVMGPSAASTGDGVVYVGNRATNEVCAVDATSMKLGACTKLPNSIDCISYVASTKEVWVTMPDQQSLAVLDASKPGALKSKATVKVPGEPEGWAVDDTRGVFFTNLEDKDKTVAIDLKSRNVTATWSPACGKEGPRGVVLDGKRNFLLVACTDHVQVLDAGHDGAALGKIDTGAGVDIIDYVESLGFLYVASGASAKLNVISVGDKGELSTIATAATSDGARNAVADAKGNAYIPDAKGGRLFIVESPAK
jgi:hypothetical protein